MRRVRRALSDSRSVKTNVRRGQPRPRDERSVLSLLELLERLEVASVAFERRRWRRVFGLVTFGGLTSLRLDGMRVYADGRASAWLYPFTNWQPPTPSLYVSRTRPCSWWQYSLPAQSQSLTDKCECVANRTTRSSFAVMPSRRLMLRRTSTTTGAPNSRFGATLRRLFASAEQRRTLPQAFALCRRTHVGKRSRIFSVATGS